MNQLLLLACLALPCSVQDGFKSDSTHCRPKGPILTAIAQIYSETSPENLIKRVSSKRLLSYVTGLLLM